MTNRDTSVLLVQRAKFLLKFLFVACTYSASYPGSLLRKNQDREMCYENVNARVEKKTFTNLFFFFLFGQVEIIP